MNKRHHHMSIIERKLEQLPAADTDFLWNDMHLILDKKMPQKKERRRFILWFLSTKGLLLLTAFFLVTASSLFVLSTKESSIAIVKELPGAPQSHKPIEDLTANVSKRQKENIMDTSESNQKTQDKLSATTSSINTVGNSINNKSTNGQAVKQSKKYAATDQTNHPTEAITGVNKNPDIAPVNLESIHHFLVASNHNEEREILSPQLAPVADRAIQKPRNNNQSGIYAGILCGVDMSSIHFNSVKTGATMGFIIGYAFNQKWSIESGLLWDTKRVYDNGSYFNPPGYTPTNGIKIVAVNGKSRLYELPINMKYTIIPGKHSLFTTAGISSYIMRSENYDYEYMQNNQPGGHNYLSYANETKNWFSVVNLSLGYNHKLGGNGNIRVEPYLKLPLNTLGVGNMPIMSSGLNVGFTKPLRR